MGGVDRAEAAARAAIGRNLRRARMLVDENRARIAEEEFGVSGTAWQKWEDGSRWPSVPVMLAFCARHRFTMEFLYTGRLDTLEERLRRRLYKRYPELLDAPDETPVPQPARRRDATGEGGGEASGRDRPPAEVPPDGPAKGRRPKRRGPKPG